MKIMDGAIFSDDDEIICIPIGYHLRELIEFNDDVTKDSLAKVLKISKPHLNALLDGKGKLTYQQIEDLSSYLGSSKAMWISLQEFYEHKLAEIKEHEKFGAIKN